MLYFQSWSGGKDSTASIILEHIHSLPQSKIIFSEVMFDKKRNISGEFPEHMYWVYNKAIPLFKSWGYEVEILHSDYDYLDLFYHIRTKSKHEDFNGKYVGFLHGKRCEANSRLKVRPIVNFLKKIEDEYIQYVGIAADEIERLRKLKDNKISLLAKYNYTEQMAFELCKKYNLVSPIYNHSKRGGCWFCPNSSIKEFAYTKDNHIELWNELKKLSLLDNLILQCFRYNKTFAEVDKEVDVYLNNIEFEKLQITLFDLLNENLTN